MLGKEIRKIHPYAHRNIVKALLSEVFVEPRVKFFQYKFTNKCNISQKVPRTHSTPTHLTFTSQTEEAEQLQVPRQQSVQTVCQLIILKPGWWTQPLLISHKFREDNLSQVTIG